MKGGRSVNGFAQPVDILPTLLELAGVDVSPEEPFHGRSFAPMLKGQRDDTDTDYAICGSYLRPSPDGAIPAEATTPVLYTEQWAYAPIGPDGKQQLFDLTTDPYGETDVASDNPDVVQSLHSRLIDWLESLDAPEEALSSFR
jgi:arylsulfatase A-like enzyme